MYVVTNTVYVKSIKFIVFLIRKKMIIVMRHTIKCQDLGNTRAIEVIMVKTFVAQNFRYCILLRLLFYLYKAVIALKVEYTENNVIGILIFYKLSMK